MKDQDWIARFNRDLDVLVQGGEPAAGAAPAAYQERLALARSLAATDLSAGRLIRQPLRGRLLAAAASGEVQTPWPVLAWGRAARTLATALPLAMVALLAVGLLAWGADRFWPRPATGTLGALALTASPTFAEALQAGPGLVGTPRMVPAALLTAVPAPTAGNSLSAWAASTEAVVPLDSMTPARARTATDVPRR